MAELLYFQPEMAFSPGTARPHQREVVADSVSGKIIKHGARADVRAWVNANPRTVEVVRGGVLIPGFVDAHNHPFAYSGMLISDPIDGYGVENKQQLIQMLKVAAKDKEKGAFIVARRLDEVRIKDLTAADLDEVSTEHKIVVYGLSYHGCFVNTRALLGVEKRGKEFERRTNYQLQGEILPNGHLTAEWVQKTWELAEEEVSVEALAQKTTVAFEDFFRRGITSIHDMDLSTSQQFLAWLLIRKTLGKRMPITRAYLQPKILEDVLSRVNELKARGLISSEDDILELLKNRQLGLKLYADGGLGAHTALLSEPYEDFPNHGQIYHTDEQLNRALDLAVRYQIANIAIHAIGDQGIWRAVNMARRWKVIAPRAHLDPTKFRIEHFELPTPEILDAVVELNAWVVLQPNFLTEFYEYEDRLGQRVDLLCSHREIMARSIPMMFGSDGMPTSALLGIYMAIHSPIQSQSLTFDEAITTYIRSSATYEDKSRGSLQEGNQADLVILDSKVIPALQIGGPMYSIEEDEAKKAELDNHVDRVYRQGELVYKK